MLRFKNFTKDVVIGEVFVHKCTESASGVRVDFLQSVVSSVSVVRVLRWF